MKKLQEKAASGEFDLLHDFQLCSLDIICETAMGTTVDAQEKTDSDYVKAVNRLGQMIVERIRKPYFRSKFVYDHFGPGKEYEASLKTVHEFTKSVIADRLKHFDREKTEMSLMEKTEGEGVSMTKNHLVFLDMLLHISENLTKLSLEDIQEEVDTFMFEGHDTTSSGLAFSAFLIASNPDVHAKVVEELDHVIGRGNRDITAEDIKELKYLECCIKEAMRLFPPVPYFTRQLLEDLTIENITFPKKSILIIALIFLHRDPKVFPDPEKFNPDRFLLENSKNRNPYSFVPFSAGPRNCIGQKFALMEEKVILAQVFRSLVLTPTQTREELKVKMELVLKPDKGIFMEVKSR